MDATLDLSCGGRCADEQGAEIEIVRARDLRQQREFFRARAIERG